MSSSSSIFNLEKHEHDVFISFRGQDTRKTFTSHLIAALRRYQIETYFDEDTLERGDEISQALGEAIQRSKIAIIVFSENYASSSWCLGELLHILKCHKAKKQVVIPIFYNIDPSDVRKQQTTYADAIKIHEERYKDKMDMVQKWKDALTQLASLSGWDSQNARPESDLVEAIARDVLTKLNRKSSSDHNFEGLIGIEEHVKNIEQLLRQYSRNVHIVGIWGMGGIGKTTIAEAVFYQLLLSCQFESSYFLRNVREESEKHGLINLRDKLLNQLLKGGNTDLGSSLLPNFLNERLRRKKVLVVLDDLNDSEQVESLVGGHDWFHRDSIIIITTRDVNVLCKEVDIIYNVERMNYDDALKLFGLIAFKGKSPSTDTFLELSKEIVKYAGGIPLAIKMLASHLRSLHSMRIRDWGMVLNVLKEECRDKMMHILKISYDGLSENEKAIFLDIACFFKGQRRDSVENILNGCGFSASIRINYLVRKSLLTICPYSNVISMHDLVQEMGWSIVKHTEKLGDCSRLWIAEDAYHILNNNEGTEKIEGIFLDMSQIDEELHVRPEVFQNMCKLRLLKIYNTSKGIFKDNGDYEVRSKVHLSQDLQSLPDRLSYLYWERYPLQHLPSQLPQNIVELHMPYSQLEHLRHETQDLNKLTTIDLRHSIHLTQMPDLSGAPNLERINLEYCTSLLQIPWHSLKNLCNLVDLNLSYCKMLCGPAYRIDGRRLENLNLRGCCNFNTLPRTLTTSLVSLDLSSTAIKCLPSSINSLKNLSELFLDDCKWLTNIPSSMQELDSLKRVRVSRCSSLDTFPNLPRNIESICLSETAIKEVSSSSIEYCFNLKFITMMDCKMLESLPTSIFKLRSLYDLDLRSCSNFKDLPEISEPAESLRRLRLDGTRIRELPSSIGNLVNVFTFSLDGCENLEYLPNHICNMAGLSELKLYNCSKLKHLPPTLGNFLSLECLSLKNCNISEIPSDIMRLSNLKKLKMTDCKKIQSLPELPLALQLLKATRCTSLVSTPNRALSQGFWKFFGYQEEYSLFYDCLKVDENGRQNIISDFQSRVLRMALQFIPPKYEIWDLCVKSCYPGDEIPKWFSYQAEGSSIIHITLPPQWHDTNFLGFAVCAVANVSCPYDNRLELRCNLDVNPNKGESFEWAFNYFKHEVGPIPTIDSDHVFMWYWHEDYHHCLDAVEAKFSFFFRKYSEHRYSDDDEDESEDDEDDEVYKSSKRIIRCGIRILHRQDVDEFRETASPPFFLGDFPILFRLMKSLAAQTISCDRRPTRKKCPRSSH
ncbi:TIR-NBS-LRR-like protein [Parasponia andersonii]|uniref:ADP-ribosyl cyclase/cyclic ADP-ribose hydrolase n=1 Tax=Parasponia andersonii TaxID=3476 RepID=A0A2P5AQ54_PARAD|nr:TIR-NBS-LRR-like protein [Parasponia andersonii]